MTLLDGIPQKVARKALQLGLHNDCIVAGVMGACDGCSEHMTLAFDSFYSDATSPEDLMERVLADMREDFVREDS